MKLLKTIVAPTLIDLERQVEAFGDSPERFGYAQHSNWTVFQIGTVECGKAGHIFFAALRQEPFDSSER